MLEEMTAIIRRKRGIGSEIWSAAHANPNTFGMGGPRSWIEEELGKLDDRTLGQMVGEVTAEMIEFANGPFADNSLWRSREVQNGRNFMIAIVAGGMIAIECNRHGQFTPKQPVTA